MFCAHTLGCEVAVRQEVRGFKIRFLPSDHFKLIYRKSHHFYIVLSHIITFYSPGKQKNVSRLVHPGDRRVTVQGMYFIAVDMGSLLR